MDDLSTSVGFGDFVSTALSVLWLELKERWCLSRRLGLRARLNRGAAVLCVRELVRCAAADASLATAPHPLRRGVWRVCRARRLDFGDKGGGRGWEKMASRFVAAGLYLALAMLSLDARFESMASLRGVEWSSVVKEPTYVMPLMGAVAAMFVRVAGD